MILFDLLEEQLFAIDGSCDINIQLMLLYLFMILFSVLVLQENVEAEIFDVVMEGDQTLVCKAEIPDKGWN